LTVCSSNYLNLFTAEELVQKQIDWVSSWHKLYADDITNILDGVGTPPTNY